MTAKKNRLGRGLNALLSSTSVDQGEAGGYQEDQKIVITGAAEQEDRMAAPQAVIADQPLREIAIGKVRANPYQPRRHWDEEALKELADSIQANGLIQPIIVSKENNGDSYQLIAGERRLRASERAGKETILALIRNVNEEQKMEWALIENIHRADLTPLERAQAYKNYITNFSLTVTEAAEKIGEERSTMTNYMRLLELAEEVKTLLEEGVMSMGHARALLALPEKREQVKYGQLVIKNNWSVRELEARIRDRGKDIAKEMSRKNQNIVELEQELTRSLGTRVTIQPVGKNQKRGRIVIEYYNLDDFDRIRERLV